jgi:alpha-glucosidase (family GH31 glycosyl hydrolase)
MKRCFIIIVLLFVNLTFSQEIKWEKYSPGIWKCQVGEKQTVDLLSAAGSFPKQERLSEMVELKFPFDEKIAVKKINGKIYLRFPLKPNEQLYGLGLQFKSVNQRGKIYNLHVDHYGGKDNGRTHAPVPFYVSSNGYGVLINSADYITMYMGTALRSDSPNQPPVQDRNTDPKWNASPMSDAVEVYVPADGVEIVVFGGEKPLDAVQRYNLYCGGGVLPPKWGLGFTYRTHTRFPAEEVLNLVDEFEKQDFPLSFVGLEPGWQSMSYSCSYEWDQKRFPQPKQFVQELQQKGVRTNLWMNPYISPNASLHEKMLPYSGSHSVWMGIVPDYTLEQARKIFSDFIQKHHLDIGVSGYKVDEVDGYDNWLWPDVAEFPSDISAIQMRQTYGVIIQALIDSLYRENNVRTFGLVRASNAGASRLPFVIYNDYYSHQDFITALCNSSFSGILWTPEARSSKTAEEWLRRVQSVCFSPMAMINAWSSGTLPWTFPDVYDAVKSVAHLRMQFVPYLYSAFAKYHYDGIPPFRAMPLVDGFLPEQIAPDSSYKKTELTRDAKDQYLMGDCLLVASVFTGEEKRMVIFPKGKWYDFYTGEFVAENEKIEINAELDEIPLFVKDGGIIPLMQDSKKDNSKKQNLEIHHYGNAVGEFMLYDDDGLTFNHENGEFSLTKLSVKRDSRGKLKGEAKRNGKNYSFGKMNWRFMSHKD